jgi:hypothetical protein
MAPKFNAGIYYPQPDDPEDNDYQKQIGFGNGNIFSSGTPTQVLKYDTLFPYDRTVAKVLKTGTQVRQKSERSILNSFVRTDTDISIGTGGAVMRDDLDGIINRFRYNDKIGNSNNKRIKLSEPKGTKSFPRWDSEEPVSKKPKGYWGNLNDLYVNVKVIIECAKSADTVENFYNTLLNKINIAAGKIWDLSVIEDDHKLKIVDKKFIQYNDLKIYQFDIGSTNKFIKSLNFTAQLSNVAANQVIASASSNKTNSKSPTGTINLNQSLQFPYGDRFNLIPPTPTTGSKERRGSSGLVDNNLESIKQLQKPPQNSTDTNGSYIMSFKSFEESTTKSYVGTGGSYGGLGGGMGGGLPPASMSNPLKEVSTTGKNTGWNIVNLVLPNETLLIALMNDMDMENNTNVYGGQQPGFTVEMTLQGISGLRTFQLFSLKNLPSPYSEREIMCQIVDVSHKVDAGNWTTTIKAGIRSIRGKSITFTTDGINEYKINQ